MTSNASIVVPYEASASSCGYCSPPGQRSESNTSYKAASLHAIKISCDVYQRMIDRGWRRSGTYCYKPDLKLGCCPQYTIRLDAKEFKPSRSQRQLLNRWNRFVLNGDSEGTNMTVDVVGTSEKPVKAKPPKAKKPPPFTTLAAALHESEIDFLSKDQTPAHVFQVTLEPSSYSAEKLALYRKYQTDVHKDVDNTPKGFKGFLVESPLQPEPIEYSSPPPSHLPTNYGSYHQMYRLDGQLIAMGVIDILPGCVSSVYFMYDTTWERFSLGKLSALREVTLAREINEAGAHNMGYLYMGFYIYSCQKMRYKGEYAPSYLADPETYEWFPLEKCIPVLEKMRYACFSEPSHSTNETLQLPDESTLASHEMLAADANEFDGTHILTRNPRGGLVLRNLKESGYLLMDEARQPLSACVRALGTDVARDVYFALI